MCAIHQPNFFPRLTTLAKLFAADYWIVLDDVQFTRRDYQHRARLAALDNPADRRWLTIPTHLPNGRQTLIREAMMPEPARSRERTARVLRQHYGASPHWPVFEQALTVVLDAFADGQTAAVAEASTRALLGLLGWRGHIVRSSGLPARPERSQRLADLAAAVRSRSYLCGTGGMRYLRPAPFAAYSITVMPPEEDVHAGQSRDDPRAPVIPKSVSSILVARSYGRPRSLTWAFFALKGRRFSRCRARSRRGRSRA
ncbi:hypothetical protein GCM10010218_27140 [Streptomyces mashuensis]|uniref:WbqC-like family protein n=1 Tax=Streptomyces mashuensis TaxID=33904 RepID=A0A919B2W8_9ACTN|nr:WbqC family protein [Streptomyces mashuensis]GHF44381.1 hypothetical protein GCM10010218_27140 [Streptomyces mashuensis]